MTTTAKQCEMATRQLCAARCSAQKWLLLSELTVGTLERLSEAIVLSAVPDSSRGGVDVREIGGDTGCASDVVARDLGDQRVLLQSHHGTSGGTGSVLAFRNAGSWAGPSAAASSRRSGGMQGHTLSSMDTGWVCRSSVSCQCPGRLPCAQHHHCSSTGGDRGRNLRGCPIPPGIAEQTRAGQHTSLQSA